MLNFGNVDPTSTNGWFLSQIRERTAAVYNSFRTIAVEGEYDPYSWLKLSRPASTSATTAIARR